MTRGEPREGIYERFVRFGAGQENNVCFHAVWNGEKYVTWPSYSMTDPFAKIGTEAKRVEGSKPRGPVSAADIEAMYQLAQRVRESYGEAAVGELPSRIKQQEIAA